MSDIDMTELTAVAYRAKYDFQGTQQPFGTTGLAWRNVAAAVVAAYREQQRARGVVEVPRRPLVRILNRLDADTMNTDEYDALLNAVYPDDLVVSFPPLEQPMEE